MRACERQQEPKSPVAALRPCRAILEPCETAPTLRNTLHAAGLLENGSRGRSSSVRVRNAVDGSTQQGGLHDSCTWDLDRKDGQQGGKLFKLFRCPQEDGLRPCTGNKTA